MKDEGESSMASFGNHMAVTFQQEDLEQILREHFVCSAKYTKKQNLGLKVSGCFYIVCQCC